MKKVYKNILFDLDKNTYADIYNNAWDEIQLIDELIEFLNGKRYASVILLRIDSLTSLNI